MSNEFLLLTGALRVFSDFSSVECSDFFIEHDTAHRSFESLRKKYTVAEIADNGNSFTKVVNLMRWVYDNVFHNGGSKDLEFLSKDSVSVLDYSFGKGVEFGVYCRLQAIVLTECCLSIGILARTIHCLPFSPNDFDSHVVSMVFIEEIGKWVLFDPSNNAYFMDKNGVALSPLEARYLLGMNEIVISDDLQPRNIQNPLEKADSYKQYMAKNLFYMKFSAKNTYGTDLVENQRTYHLIPKGFNAKEREIAYCEYAIKNAPDHLRSDWENALEGFKKQEVIAVSQGQFLRTE